MASTRIDPLEQVRAVTSNFFFWQGLRWVPMGVALLVVTWMLGSHTAASKPWQSPLLGAVMIVSLALSAAAGRWYDRVYGRVRGIPGAHARRTRTKWLVVYPMLLAALLADVVLRPPVLVSGIAFAAAIEAYRRSTGGGRRHYIGASVLFLGLTFVPVLGLARPGIDALNLLFGVLGGTYVIGGVLDHFALRRVLPRAPDTREHGYDDHAGSTASVS